MANQSHRGRDRLRIQQEVQALLGVVVLGMGVPRGMIDVARLRVEEAGLDIAEVESWVQRHGGEIIRARIESKGLGRGMWQRPAQDATRYLIPAAALNA